MIDEVYTANNQVFEELDIMREVAYKSCPNILELQEVFEDEQLYYIATNYQPGGDLHNYLQKMQSIPLSEDHAKVIIKQVALGIQALH